jgi:outer membrane lipoprotein carrier protein
MRNNVKNKRMKNIFTFIAALLFANILCAQQKEDRKINNDPKAQAILDKLSKNYKSLKSLESSFTLSMFSKADDIDEKFNGKVFLKGQKYKLDTEQMEITCDNVKRYVWMKDPNEITISLYEPDGESIESPAQLFTIYEKNFYYKLLSDEKVGTKHLKKIELVPQKVKESQYKKVILLIDEALNQIVKAVIESKDGVTYTWEIKEFKPNASVDDKLFVFDKARYPKAHIEDMTK